MSNAPTVLMGLVPLIRAVVRSSTTATATTVTADDSGTLFVNLSTSAHTYTLPVVALGAGKSWMFFNGDGTSTIAVTSGTADVMMCDDDAAATTNTSSTDAVGDCLWVIGDGTYYYCFEIHGTYTAT